MFGIFHCCKRAHHFVWTKRSTSWTQIFSVLKVLLSISGLNYISSNYNRLARKLYCYGNIGANILIGGLSMIQLVLPNSYDTEDYVYSLIVIFIALSVALKVLTILYNSERLKFLWDYIMKTTDKDLQEQWEIDLGEKYFRSAKQVFMLFVVLYILVCLNLNALPYFSAKDYMMPILIEFPSTNRSSSAGFKINYLLGVYSVFYGTLVEMAFDIPVFLQAIFISYQFDRCIHFCNLIGDRDTIFDTDEKQRTLLRQCIIQHGNLLQFIGKVTQIITYVVALTIITIVPTITLTLYSAQLGNVSAAYMMGISCVCHLFMYCYSGQIVTTKCEDLQSAIYSSKWYNIPSVKEKKLFLFFLTNSQRDVGFSAGGLYKLSMETFTELMKRSYAAFAFLMEIL